VHQFWDTITEPVLEALQPKTLVEIGSDQGFNTRKLLGFCQQHDTKLHVIDPLPKYDVAAWQEQYGEHLVFHRALSLDALPTIDRFDAVLIDGDHNWYTVFNELKLLEERSKDPSLHFPLVMLHDIGWPYGRRDLYYNPETIPEEYRKPYEQSGMRPESEELLEDGGLNRSLANAVSENDPRNGVLTAVEDFLEETEQLIELVQLPGLNGLGILVPSQFIKQNSKLAGFLGDLDLSPTLTRYLELVEEARIEMEIDLQEHRARSQRLRRRWEKQQAELEKENNRLKKKRARWEKQQAELKKKQAQSEERQAELEQWSLQLVEENQRLTQQLQDIQNSKSWRLLSTLNRIGAKTAGR
jgi:hypothetical protein